MRLLLKRRVLSAKSTIGDLYINDVFECHTLEDCVREVATKPVSQWKIPGTTAIPAGSYDVVIDFSSRFKRRMPHVLNVPGFEGIRIHTGNSDADTEGCILLGKTVGTDFVGQSHVAFDDFFPKLDAVLSEFGGVTLSIVNPQVDHGGNAWAA